MDTLSKEGDCYEEEKFNFESFVENERGIYQFMDEETMLCNVVDNGEKLIIQGNVQDLINSKIVTTESVQQYRQAYLQDIEDNETGNAQSEDSGEAPSSKVLTLEQTMEDIEAEEFQSILLFASNGDNDDGVGEKKGSTIPTTSGGKKKWTIAETKVMLEHMKPHLFQIGPMKRFKNRKSMLEHVAQETSKSLGCVVTGTQVDSRFKTVKKQSKEVKKSNEETGSTRKEDKYQLEMAEIAAEDDSFQPAVKRGVGKVVFSTIKKTSPGKAAVLTATVSSKSKEPPAPTTPSSKCADHPKPSQAASNGNESAPLSGKSRRSNKASTQTELKNFLVKKDLQLEEERDMKKKMAQEREDFRKKKEERKEYEHYQRMENERKRLKLEENKNNILQGYLDFMIRQESRGLTNPVQPGTPTPSEN